MDLFPRFKPSRFKESTSVSASMGKISAKATENIPSLWLEVGETRMLQEDGKSSGKWVRALIYPIYMSYNNPNISMYTLGYNTFYPNH